MRKHLHYRMILFFTFLSFGFTVAMGQTGTLTGTVSDKTTGEKLPGANIYVEGTTIGVSTDIDGKYTLKVPAGKHVIACSYTGYQKATFNVEIAKDQTISHDFLLAEGDMQLDEVVVVGYGTKRKRDITSSISTIKAEDIQAIPVDNFAKAMQGKTPGVQITQDNGMLGSAATVRVRGTTSLLGSSEPLYVVDGVPIESGNYTNQSGYPDKVNILSQLDPNDIESVEILKDAAAAAIYGARSANGVFLITTKKGKLTEGKAKTNISVNYYAGITTVTHKLPVLDGSTYLELTKEAWFNSGKGTERQYYEQLPYGIYNTNILYQGDYNNFTEQQKQETFQANRKVIDNTNTDWISQMLRIGNVQSANISLTGGTSRTQFFVNGSYYGENGILLANNLQRLSGRINFSHKITDWFDFGITSSISKTIDNQVPTGWAGGLGTAQSRSLPIMPVYNNSGGWFAPKSSNGTNTVAVQNDIKKTVNTMYIIASFYADLHFTKWLWIRDEFGLNNFYIRDYKYEGTITHEQSSATDQRSQVENYTNLVSLNFQKIFKKKHDVSAFAGFQVQNQNYAQATITGSNSPSINLQQPNNGAIITGGNWLDGYGYLSIIGRATYAFNNKYYLTASVRRDASSKFGPGKKWGWFPAVSAGWTITEEKFFPEVIKKVMSYFKLRASYGITGNSPPGNFQYVGQYSSATYNGLPGIKIDHVGNPDLHWEPTYQTDIGFDIGFLAGRISGGFDWYYKQTNDILLNVNVPQTSGTSTITKNVGSMFNRGIEIFVNSNNLVGKFKWRTEFNINHNYNQITNIEGQIVAGENYGNNYAQEGHPIGAWRLVEYYGVDSKTGKELFVLADGSVGPWDDSDPNFFARNAIVTGNPYPLWMGGVNNIFTWKGIDLSIFFTYQWGVNVYRDDGKFFEGGQIGSNWNQMTTIENRWQKPGDEATTPQLLWTNTYSTHNSTRYLDDASFLRLKTFTLGYTFPQKWMKSIYLTSLRVYFMATNWWTYTKYKGWDPEVNRDGSGNITANTTYLSPPQAKTFTLGLQVNL